MIKEEIEIGMLTLEYDKDAVGNKFLFGIDYSNRQTLSNEQAKQLADWIYSKVN